MLDERTKERDALRAELGRADDLADEIISMSQQACPDLLALYDMATRYRALRAAGGEAKES